MVGRKRKLKRYYVPSPWEPYESDSQHNDSPPNRNQDSEPTPSKVSRKDDEPSSAIKDGNTSSVKENAPEKVD